jgi:hypothetical protein
VARERGSSLWGDEIVAWRRRFLAVGVESVLSSRTPLGDTTEFSKDLVMLASQKGKLTIGNSEVRLEHTNTTLSHLERSPLSMVWDTMSLELLDAAESLLVHGVLLIACLHQTIVDTDIYTMMDPIALCDRTSDEGADKAFGIRDRLQTLVGFGDVGALLRRLSAEDGVEDFLVGQSNVADEQLHHMISGCSEVGVQLADLRPAGFGQDSVALDELRFIRGVRLTGTLGV